MTVKQAFEQAMTGRHYGTEERADAFAWFKAGWNAMARFVPMPTKAQIAAAEHEIEEEDRAAEKVRRQRDIAEAPVIAENKRRSNLPSEHPDHICGVMCDGQDGANSSCGRIRTKLFGKRATRSLW